MASKTIESVALVGTAMKLFQAAIGWVRYLNGGERIRLQDVLYAAGHVYGAWTVGTQITALASSLGWSWPAAALLGQIAWIAWALAVLIYGERRDDALSRYVGLILVCVPAITDPNWRIERTELFELWLLAATGIALSMYAAARTRARTRLVR
jgi:hypothetical protein